MKSADRRKHGASYDQKGDKKRGRAGAKYSRTRHASFLTCDGVAWVCL